jgi:uncharacterized membrane protein
VSGLTQARHELRHPGVQRYLDARGQSWHARLADGITAFAGSMVFVYVHVLVFAVWMLVLERNPWPTLTLVVSLEAIFLSTFVLIGQNRQTAVAQAKADHDFVAQELELRTNTELTRDIHSLLQALELRLDAEDQGPPVVRSVASDGDRAGA